MANDERQEQLEAVSTRLETFADVDARTLARTSELSPDINFKEAVPYFEEMLDLCRQLNQRDLSRLPAGQLREVLGACEQLEHHITEVKAFNLNQNTPGDVCRNIIRNVANAYDGVVHPMLLPLAFTATQATDYARIEREAKGYHATMKAEAEELAQFMEGVRKDTERALAAVKEQAAEAGVATNAQIFTRDSDQHKAVASKWLRATIGLGAVTVLAAIGALLVAFEYRPNDLSATIQYVVAKVLLLSTLSFSVAWCARNYRAQKHNETLNKHRANALMTFKAFVEGTSDERVKDALLLQAAQAAFSGRQTGFDSTERDPQKH